MDHSFPLHFDPRTGRTVANDLQSAASSENCGGAKAGSATLASLAVRSLAALLDKNDGFFSARLVVNGDGYRRDQCSLKRMSVALMGLQRLADAGIEQPFNMALMCEAVDRDRSWIKNAGDLGLFAWFTAVCCPERLQAIFRELDFERALESNQDGKQSRTTALAWFLAGISHAALRMHELCGPLTDLAADTYRLLLANQGEDGIFGHAGAAAFPRSALYSRFGTFTDQIFSIYALCTFARAFEIEEPLEPALACGNALTAQQGEMGQWWFLYDKRTSRVAKRYPVECRHQAGTAALGLSTLEKATGRSFQRAIDRGTGWLSGVNELQSNLAGVDENLIWDSIGHNVGVRSYWDAALCLFKPLHGDPASGLVLRHEVRPDSLGWSLYGLSQNGLDREASALAMGQQA